MSTDAESVRAQLAGLIGTQRVTIVVVPLMRLALGAAALAGVAAAGVGGYWLAVGNAGVQRLFAAPEPAEPWQAALDMPEQIVNLRSGTPSRYLKIGITLALAPQDRERVTHAMPHLVSAQQEFLRNLDQHDLQGSAGLYRLRAELRRRFNLIVGQDVVAEVLLRSFLTQ